MLTGQTALVTGSTRGIGLGIAAALLAEGANVVVNGRSKEKGDEALAGLGVGVRTMFIRGDVSEQAVCEDLVEQTVTAYGAIDILVCNGGGTNHSSTLAEMPDEVWNYQLNWNLGHTMWSMRQALRHMIPRKSGRIINISSLYGKIGMPTISPYVTSKHAINGLTKAVAAEVGTLGITVNAVCPGYVRSDTFMTDGPQAAAALGMDFEAWVDAVVAGSAIKRTIEIEEVASTVVFLCSKAGAGITGALLSVDGGTAPY
jgi:3-hydroxybutyrate dehydrogenase/3-oxoacyl-[acyl-carrier protein] reductase